MVYYRDRKILNNINFSIQKGKKYAIIGESGSGKSTFCRMLQNYFKDYSGSLSIDGKEYKDLPQEAFADIISTTDQDVFLFDGTVKENITLFKEVKNCKLVEILYQASLDQVVFKNPKFLDQKTVDGGKRISGGEKQRIGIARSLLRESPILILDEITSALDKENAYKVLHRILKEKERTCIHVTHKLRPEEHHLYDEIIEFGNGGIKRLVKRPDRVAI